MTRRPTALGAYVFAGGFTLGVREHFDVLAHLEGDGGYGVACARANFPDLEVRHGPARWDAADFAGVDFVYTNPPCAIFSQAGASAVQSLDWRDDPRVACWRDCFGLLETLRPRAWALESVSQAYTRGRELVDELTRRALLLGYSVTHLLEDARWHGLPQKRRRFLLLCHGPARLAAAGLNFAPPPDVMDVLGLVDDPGPTTPLKPAVLDLLAHVPPGVSLRRIWEERGKPTPGGPPFLQYRLPTGAPRHAFVGDHQFHPVQPRRIGENEMRAVCGFPPDFRLTGGNVGENGSLLARGLMPPVAAWVAGVVARTLESPDADAGDRRVTFVDASEPGRDPVDLTDLYLNERGKVRMRIVRTAVTSEPRPDHVAPVAAAGPERAHVAARPRTVVTEHPRAEPGEGSGKFMQRLFLTTDMTPEEIVAAVHANWEGRTTKVSDCAFNYNILKRANAPGLRPWPGKTNSVRAETDERRTDQPAAPPQADADPKVIAHGSSTTERDRPGTETVGHVAQPTRANIRDVPDADGREYDTTSLTEASHGYKVHRDYAAHFFRWGFVRRHVGNANHVLEIGCGADFPFRKSITYPMHVPARYVGVDLNPLAKAPSRGPWTFHGSFNFNERYAELGRDFDTVVSLEVIEHMTRAHGDELLRGAKHCLAPGGRFFLSTPVFDGHAAANHVHEYTVPELREAVEAAGFVVVRRFGTFINQRDVKQVCTPEQWATLQGINEYYSTDVSACFLAPLFPDQARNNLWWLEHAT